MEKIRIPKLTAKDIGRKMIIKTKVRTDPKGKKETKEIKAVLVSWNTLFLFGIPYTSKAPEKSDIYNYHTAPFKPHGAVFV